MTPSDDIVTRLRQFGDSNGLDAEAADEIERLRAEVNTMACAQDGWGQLERVKAENERLHRALALAVGELSTYAPYGDRSPEDLFEFFKEAVSHD